MLCPGYWGRDIVGSMRPKRPNSGAKPSLGVENEYRFQKRFLTKILYFLLHGGVDLGHLLPKLGVEEQNF
jgi:hypothetical protein